MRALSMTVLFAGIALTCAAPAHAADIRGSVFNDFNMNGKRDANPLAAIDVGVADLTVRAYDAAGTLVATTRSGADGEFVLTGVPSGRARVELEVAHPWWPTRQLAGLRSDEQFVTAGGDVAFGVHRLGEYSVANPLVFWPLQWAGPPAAPDGNGNRDAIRGMRYDSSIGRPDAARPWSGLPDAAKRAPARFEQIGTVLGLAVDQASGDLFAGAYYKRFAGLLERGAIDGLRHPTGAIFRITQAGDVSLWADLDAGPDEHPDSRNIDDWVDPGSAKFDRSWDAVGRRGLGALAIDPAGRNLYTVNLFDRTLVRLPLRGTAPAATPIPAPGCPADWRPFSVAFDPADGVMYAGGVCSAGLRAVVYRVSDPTGAPRFDVVLDVALTYRRVTTGAFLAGFDDRHAAVQSDWHPWPAVGLGSPAADTRGTVDQYGVQTRRMDESYPQLNTIAFDHDGSMILGLRDLMGDMSGVAIPGEQFVFGTGKEDGSGNNGTFRTVTAQGDLLRAARAGSAFSLESGGTAGALPAAWTPSAGPIGPGGDYFYDPHSPCCQNEAPSGFQGGVTQVPGFAHVVSTAVDVSRFMDNGLLWHRDADGVKNAPGTTDTERRIQNMTTDAALGGFGKANGLGDLAAFRQLAPVQIGNRLWYDDDRDGTQEAGERPVGDAIVELYGIDEGTVISSKRTDSEGEYVFQIDPEGRYRVRVPLDQDPLSDYTVTTTGAGTNARIDSNGRVHSGRSEASVASHDTGENDHSYDFGFVRGEPPARAAAVEQPAPPEEAPDVAGEEPTPLVLVKYADRSDAAAGQRVQFTMVVHNPSPATLRGIRVCDELPEELVALARSRFGRNLSGRRVCWRREDLSSGASRRYRVTTRVGSAQVGVIVNRASAGGERARALLRVRRAPRVTG